MTSFAGPLPPPLPRDAPSIPRPAPQQSSARVVKLTRLKEKFQNLDLEDEDDDDDFITDSFPYSQDSFEDVGLDGKRRPPAKLPLSKLSRSKKAVKVVSKRSSMDSMNNRKPSLFDRDRASNSTNRGQENLDLSHMLHTDLSSSRWEERAYEIVRRQKLRSIAAQQNENKLSEQPGNQMTISRQKLRSIAAQQNEKKLPKHQDNQTTVSRQKMRSIAAQQNEKKPPEQQDNQTTISHSKQSSVGEMDGSVFCRLATRLDLEKKCRPVIEYLHCLGLEEVHFQKIAQRRKICFQINLAKVRERLEYLTSLGVKVEDLSKMIVRHPQVLEYTVERMMKPRIQYLKSLGIPDAKLGRIITVAPSLLECSLERSLKPRVRFLLEEVGISPTSLWKIVVLSPQVLTQSIEESLRPRLDFFVKKLGASQERVAKMITKHPQLLHYSIEDGIQPRIDFLRSIGMSDPDIVKVLSRFSQILSLSVEKSLKPKSDYLTKELKCELQAVTSFPAYFSLSLEQRIRPRHRFLMTLKRLPQGPFPMHLLAVTDQEFCKRWANSTVQDYYAFRQAMVLSSFAKKFERRNRLQFNLSEIEHQ